MPKPTPKATPTPNSWAALIFQLYLALVCSFSLAVGVFSAGGLLTGALDLAIPPRPMVSETRWDDTARRDVPRPAEEIARDQAQQVADQAFNTRREMAHSLIYLVLGLTVFGFHWRLFKARKE